MDYAWLGAVNGVPAGTSGTYYFDAFESRRSTYIGQAGGLRLHELGKSMRKAGLMKLIAAKPNLAGRYAPLQEEVLLDAPTDYLFTGQRWEQELGLYLMGSRWFDPRLGRFIQADSIVPNPLNPLAFDRYAYVYNSPTNNIDPSGNRPCDDVDADGKCISKPGWNKKEKFTTAGADLNELFKKLREKRGGKLSLEEFVGLWILHEGGGDFKQADIVAQAVAQRLFVGGWTGGHCRGGCFAGVFNFMAAYTGEGTAGGFMNGIKDPGTYIGPGGMYGRTDDSEVMALAFKYGTAALHPRSLNPDRYNALSNWGNDPKRTQYFRHYKPYIEEGIPHREPEAHVYYFFDSWYAYSVNQANSWADLNVDDAKIPKKP